jgi:hypothetical protein
MRIHRTYHERKYAFGQQVLTCRTRAAEDGPHALAAFDEVRY